MGNNAGINHEYMCNKINGAVHTIDNNIDILNNEKNASSHDVCRKKKGDSLNNCGKYTKNIRQERLNERIV